MRWFAEDVLADGSTSFEGRWRLSRQRRHGGRGGELLPAGLMYQQHWVAVRPTERYEEAQMRRRSAVRCYLWAAGPCCR